VLATGVAVAAVLTAATAGGLAGSVFFGFRARAADSLFPSVRIDPRIVVLGIDRQSIVAQNQLWPWPRDVQAKLVDALAADGVRLAVLDVVQSTPAPGDPALEQAVRASHNVVLAATADLARRRSGRLFEAKTLTSPLPALAQAAAGVGQASVVADPDDGVVRSLPLVVDTPGNDLVPSLTLEAVAQLDGYTGPPTIRPHGIQLGDRYVPTGDLGLLQIDYSAALEPSAEHLPYVSAADVLSAKAPRDELAGKVVLVGVTEPTLGDTHLTPNDKGGGMPGVFVHANALNTMLTRSYIAPATTAEILLWVFGLALVVALATRTAPLWLSPLVAVALTVGYVTVAFHRFDGGVVMDLIYPPLALALAFVAALVLRVGTEVRQRRRMVRLLGQYVPASVARQLIGRRGAAMPTGTITFLFTDVVGSTVTWDAYPREMSVAMRRHDILVEDAVERHGGAIVRPRGEGDSRFAVFVRPRDAVGAAGAILGSFAAERWPTPEPVRLRLAVHTGEADLREGDYYGTAVNRCARIRSVAGGGQALVSEVTAHLVGDDVPAGVTLRDVGLRELKDFATPEHVFSVEIDEAESSLTHWGSRSRT
jgi:CHASE2 domain-containing sensor protein